MKQLIIELSVEREQGDLSLEIEIDYEQDGSYLIRDMFLNGEPYTAALTQEENTELKLLIQEGIRYHLEYQEDLHGEQLAEDMSL